MKMIAIIDVPDGEGKWYIDGEIRYTEDESLMKKFDNNMIQLKPLPKKFIPVVLHQCVEDEYLYQKGWNDCLKEIAE